MRGTTSAVVLNHQIMLKGAGHSAIGNSRLLYIANRPGAVMLETDDDVRIEAENERMARLGYIAFRPGSVPEPNKGHALFDQSGIPVRAEVQKELVATESAIITSVVSVRRQDAEALGLSTKQDWERLLRAHWRQHVEELDVMEPQDIRWVAAMHVNQPNNVHVHVFTWDASGRYDGLIPRRKLVPARERFVERVLQPRWEELGLERTQARDELVELVRSRALTAAQRESVVQAVPEAGSLKYGRLYVRFPEARAAVDAVVDDALGRDAEAARLLARYRDAVREHARLKALSGAKLEAYQAAAESDLRCRLGNAVLRNALPDRRPRLKMSVEDGHHLAPGLRRKARALHEEVASCLSSEEAETVHATLRDALGGKDGFTGEAADAMRKAPTLSGGKVGKLTAFLRANPVAAARMLARTAEQDGGADPGDEAAKRALRSSARVARVMAAALTHVPAAPPGALLRRLTMTNGHD